MSDRSIGPARSSTSRTAWGLRCSGDTLRAAGKCRPAHATPARTPKKGQGAAAGPGPWPPGGQGRLRFSGQDGSHWNGWVYWCGGRRPAQAGAAGPSRLPLPPSCCRLATMASSQRRLRHTRWRQYAGREKVGENCQIPAAGLQSQGDCCENVGYDSCCTFLQDYQDALTHQLSLMLTCDPGVNLKQAAFFKEYTLLPNCVVSTGRTATFQHMSHLVLFKGIQSPPLSVLRSPSPSQPEPLMP